MTTFCIPEGARRVLLVEDDPVSHHFMKAVLEELSVTVDVAIDSRSARRLADEHSHALWMIDVNLPDGCGMALLHELRAQGKVTPALAHTADASSVLASRLRDAGFAGVLTKPMPKALLQSAVQAHWAPTARPVQTGDVLVRRDVLWDDRHALSALNGHTDHMIALRRLFLNELPSVRQSLRQGIEQDDTATLRHHLHRLQASCGFVGATHLAATARMMHEHPLKSDVQQALMGAIDELLPS